MKGIRKIRLNNNPDEYGFGGYLKDHWFTAATTGGLGLAADALSHGKFSKFMNNNAGTIGTIGGGIAGAFVGNPMMGAQLGSSIGNVAQSQAEQENANNAQYAEAQKNALNKMQASSTKNLSPNQNDMQQQIPYASGGIHINPKNKGKFNALKKRTGKSTEELTHSKNPLTRKRAIFAQNAKKWHHGDGGMANANAEFERGEPYMTPDGTIHKISDQAPTHAQGGVPVNVPDGTMILGKNPIMDTEFKKLGSKLKTTQDKADKTLEDKSTALARSTAIRNLQNVHKKWNSLFQIQEMQKMHESMNKYGDGGKVLVYENHGNDFDEGYSKKLDNQGKRINQKYFYQSKDSIFDFQGDTSDYEAHSYKKGKPSKMYDKNNKIPVDAWVRTTDAINKLQSTATPEEYGSGGLSKDYIEKAHHRAGGSNVGKYNMNQTFAGPSGGAPKGSFPIGDIHHAKSALKLAHNAPNPAGIKAAVYRKYPSLKHGDGGMVQYPDGGSTPDWYNWMSTTTPDINLVNAYAKSNPIGANGKTVSTNPNDIMSYWNQVHSGNNNYMGTNKWATGPALFNYSNSQSNQQVPRDPRAIETMTPMTPRGGAFAANGDLAQPNPGGLKGGYRPAEYQKLDTNRKIYQDTTPDMQAGSNLETYGALGASLIPGLYNMGRSIFGKADKLNSNDYKNPYEDQALAQLRDRKYDIDPILREINTGNRISDYNAKNYGGSRSEMINRLQGNVVNRNRAIADAYTQKYNIENQYKGDYANALMQAGVGRANMNFQTALWNKQAKATKDNLFGTGLGQVSQSAMDYLKYRNQLRNDAFRQQAIKEGLQYYDLSKDLSLIPKQ